MDEITAGFDQYYLDQITQMGIFGYPIEKVMILLNVTQKETFTRAFNDPNSAINKAYQKGVHQADFLLDAKLWSKANTGDMEALKRFEARKEMRLKQQQKPQAY